jgi:hypothetical protein
MTSEFSLLRAFGIFVLDCCPFVVCRGSGSKILSYILLSGKQSLHLRCKCCLEFLHFGIDSILHIPLRKVSQLLIIHVLCRVQDVNCVVQCSAARTNVDLIVMLTITVL